MFLENDRVHRENLFKLLDIKDLLARLINQKPPSTLDKIAKTTNAA